MGMSFCVQCARQNAKALYCLEQPYADYPMFSSVKEGEGPEDGSGRVSSGYVYVPQYCSLSALLRS